MTLVNDLLFAGVKELKTKDEYERFFEAFFEDLSTVTGGANFPCMMESWGNSQALEIMVVVSDEYDEEVLERMYAKLRFLDNLKDPIEFSNIRVAYAMQWDLCLDSISVDVSALSLNDNTSDAVA